MTPSPDPIRSGVARRAALSVYVGCFAIGGTNHALDFLHRGWRPYRWAPPPLELYWSSLILLDFAVVALLLRGRRRRGLALAVGVMLSDVAVNTSAWLLAIVDMGMAMLLQSLFLGFVLGSTGFLWRDPDRA